MLENERKTMPITTNNSLQKKNLLQRNVHLFAVGSDFRLHTAFAPATRIAFSTRDVKSSNALRRPTSFCHARHGERSQVCPKAAGLAAASSSSCYEALEYKCTETWATYGQGRSAGVVRAAQQFWPSFPKRDGSGAACPYLVTWQAAAE